MGSFAERTHVLGEMVGDGDLECKVLFSGPHAAAQHEGPGSQFAPPSWAGKGALDYTVAGTGPKFLSGPLLEQYPRWLQDLADDVLVEPRGLAEAAEDVVDDWADVAARRAPKDDGDLRRSATGRVYDDGRLAYQR